MRWKHPSVVLLVLSLAFCPVAFGTEFKTEPSVVELNGQFIMPRYRDVKMDKIGKYFALELDSPIDVEGGKSGGPAKGVRVIELILTGDRDTINALVARYHGSRVKVTGTLFHAHESYHRTKVLIRVQKIQKE